LLGLFVLVFGRGAGANTYTVINFADRGVGSLRQAIMDANANPGADTIVFALPANRGHFGIELASALPTITDDLDIQGPGVRALGVVTVVPVPFSEIQIGTGNGVGPTVTISAMRIGGGTSIDAGAINCLSGTVTLVNVLISNNRSQNFGSGITNAGTMTLTGCSLFGNTTSYINADPPVASRFGGGIYNTGTLTMTNCTVSGNTVSSLETSAGQSVSQGGGIYNAGTLHLSHSTIYNNQTIVTLGASAVPGQGGGIYNTGSLTIDDTILQDGTQADGISNGGGSLINSGGTVVTQGYNLSNDSASGLLTGTGDIINKDALLGGLPDTGGDIPSFIPQLSSPAINAGDPAFVGAPLTDQRGQPRVLGKRIDIGAVEYRQPFDFADDAHSDILFQNSQTNQIAAWSLNGLNVQSGLTFSSTPAAGWKLVGSADLNRDGWPDLLFQNTTTKLLVAWFMRGNVYIGGKVITPPTFAPTPYDVVGIASFNGQINLVFEDTVNHQIYYGIYDPITTLLVSTSLTGPEGPFLPKYHVVGVGDFDRNGVSDLLFQNSDTGQLVVTDAAGAPLAGGGVISSVPGNGWLVKAVADYNNDGKPDIVFQNATTNQVVVWYMNGLSFMGGGALTSKPLAPYQLVGPH